MRLGFATLPAAPPRQPAARARPVPARGRRVAVLAGHLAVAVLIAGAAGWLRRGPLGPSSLWLDDAWVALVTRTDSAGTALIGMTAPGFAFLLRAWLAVVGFTETRAQALPFALGVAGPALLYLLGLRLRLRPVAAAVGASLLATAPVHVEYASRVKHYTLDAVLAAAVVAAAGWALADLSRPRRWVVAALVAAAATAASGALAAYAAAVAAAGAVALRRGAPGATGAARRAAGAALGGYAAFAAAWWWAVLRPVLNPDLRAYWAGHYVDLDAGTAGAAADVGRGLAGVVAGLSASAPAGVVLLAVVGAGVLAARRPPVAVLLVVPLGVAVVLSAAQMAPLGGGRTDTYLYPALALLVAAGTDALLRWPRAGALVAVGVVAALTVGAAPPAAYPAQDVRPLVAEVERRAAPGDAIVVYPATIWAYALYTEHPVELVTDSSQGWGFEPVVGDPRVAPLGRHRSEPERYGPELDRLAGAHDQLWLVATHWRDDLPVIEGYLRGAGLRESGRWERPGARLVRFTAPLP